MKHRNIIIVFLFLGLTIVVTAKEYYVAPLGRVNADGTRNNPIRWVDFQKSLDALGGGHTFIFLPGVYTGQQITLYPRNAGTPQRPTVLKSEYKYKAKLHGSLYHNIYILLGCNWTIIDGFECSGADFTGIKSDANYTVIRNNWIHNNVQGIGAHGVHGNIIERNLIEYNGQHLQFDHGVYASGTKLVIRNNIIRFNSAWGLHLYPKISSSYIENNLIYGNVRYGLGLYSDPNIGGNKIINNTIVRNGSGITIRQGKAEIVYNNIIADNNYLSWRWDSTSLDAIDISKDTDVNSLDIDFNLCRPMRKQAGKHSFDKKPGFLNNMKCFFYLKSDSPARNSGSVKYYAKTDFWGKERKAPIDIGCFSFNEDVLKSAYRSSWYLEWPFHARDTKGRNIMVDLWQKP
jgi:hypothetical protein